MLHKAARVSETRSPLSRARHPLAISISSISRSGASLSAAFSLRATALPMLTSGFICLLSIGVRPERGPTRTVERSESVFPLYSDPRRKESRVCVIRPGTVEAHAGLGPESSFGSIVVQSADRKDLPVFRSLSSSFLWRGLLLLPSASSPLSGRA